MFKRFADRKHEEQANEFLLSLGRFMLAFERVNESLSFIIIFLLRNQGLKNEGMAQVISANRSDRGQRELLGALCAELPGQDEDDRKAVQSLLKSIDRVASRRNVLVHSNWFLGLEAAKGEFRSWAFQMRRSRESGASIEEHGFSASDVDRLTRKAQRCEVLLQRLSYCICQRGFKVSTELRKPL